MIDRMIVTVSREWKNKRGMLLFKIFTFLSNYPNVNFWDIFILNKNRTVEKNFIEFDQTFHESGIINEKEEARRRRKKRIPGIFATRKKEEKESWNVSQFFSLSIQKHSFSNIFNIFKFHRVILPETVISSRDLMDYLWERVRIFNFILTMALTSKFTRIRWNYCRRTRWDSLRKKGERDARTARGKGITYWNASYRKDRCTRKDGHWRFANGGFLTRISCCWWYSIRFCTISLNFCKSWCFRILETRECIHGLSKKFNLKIKKEKIKISF